MHRAGDSQLAIPIVRSGRWDLLVLVQLYPVGRPPCNFRRAPHSSRAAGHSRTVAAARVRNAQAFAPWSKDEEQEVLRRFKAGDSVETIAKARKRSVRAIELRLQRLGALPPS